MEKPGLACYKNKKKQRLDVERSNARGTERADKGGGGCRRVGGNMGKTAEQEKVQKTQKRDLGGVLRQPHNFPDWKVLRFFGPGKK